MKHPSLRGTFSREGDEQAWILLRYSTYREGFVEARMVGDDHVWLIERVELTEFTRLEEPEFDLCSCGALDCGHAR